MRRIDDYAPIGDGRSAALVSRAGAIEWLCWPRFDSPSLFARLLDDDGGRWLLAPTAPSETRRAYAADTNVLETTFATPAGRVVITDFMPVASEHDKGCALHPEHEILRIARCTDGEVELVQDFAPRPGYGERPRLHDRGALGLCFEASGGTAVFRTSMPMQLHDGGARGTVRLRAGDTLYAALDFAHDGPAILPPLGLPSECALQRTLSWWRDWAARVRYDGPFTRRRAPQRAGAQAPRLRAVGRGGRRADDVAARALGGDLNWDYRFCWLRDASLTHARAHGARLRRRGRRLLQLAPALDAADAPALQILYDVHGNDPEQGARARPPARLSTARARCASATPPSSSMQLDVYGEVIDAVAQLVRADGGHARSRDRAHAARLRRVRLPPLARARRGHLGAALGPRRSTRTRACSAGSALDRLHRAAASAASCAACRCERLRTRPRAAIRAEIETRAWNERAGSYVATLDGEDARRQRCCSWPGTASKTHARRACAPTYDRIRDELGAGRRAPLSLRQRRFARRGRLRHLQLLGRRVPRARRRQRRRGRARARRARLRTPTTSASSPRRSIRRPAPRSATSRRRSRTSGSSTRPSRWRGASATPPSRVARWRSAWSVLGLGACGASSARSSCRRWRRRARASA